MSDPLEPLPETTEALAELLSFENPRVDEAFLGMGETARTVVPELVGLSLTLVEEGVTFTLAAPSVGVASLDAMQYLDDGPCERAVEEARPIASGVQALLDEGLWHVYARAAAASGVESSLSMPIIHEGEVRGGLNLYGASPDAFDDRWDRLAGALGASAEHAVTNADLSFATRLQAVKAPGALRDANRVDTAVGILAARYGESVGAARERLESVAARANVPLPVLARVVISVHRRDDRPWS
jgi:GAF domain-containing protein